MAAGKNPFLLALVTLPTRPLTVWLIGTSRTLKGVVVRTSIASGVPEAGNTLSLSLLSATTFDGSTSAWIERFGWITVLGTARFHDVPREPSFGLSGTPTAGRGDGGFRGQHAAKIEADPHRRGGEVGLAGGDEDPQVPVPVLHQGYGAAVGLDALGKVHPVDPQVAASAGAHFAVGDGGRRHRHLRDRHVLAADGRLVRVASAAHRLRGDRVAARRELGQRLRRRHAVGVAARAGHGHRRRGAGRKPAHRHHHAAHASARVSSDRSRRLRRRTGVRSRTSTSGGCSACDLPARGKPGE